MDNKPQKTQNERASTIKEQGEARATLTGGKVLSVASQPSEHLPNTNSLMEAIVCDRRNLKLALKRVIRNQGAPGIDGMTVEELTPYLKENWVKIRTQLLEGKYEPQPSRRVEIPKPDGKGIRKLNIPVVLDRFIQQAMLQVLQPEIDPSFSKHSYGFRPGKSAHQAVDQAQEYIAQGYRVVVDIDLENFFNNVNHDKLMSEIAKRIPDKRVLKLLRKFLTVGILENGLASPSEQGTGQGSPISPLLSNIMLDLLDKELEQRGHKYCRFADDCNVYVKSKRAGDRVMKSLGVFISKKLKLKVNEQKSGVDTVNKRRFLGFSFTNGKVPKRRIAPKALRKFKEKVRKITRTSKGMCMENVINQLSKYTKGWLAYFNHCETPSVLDKLESWMRRKLRCAYWRQWKTDKNRAKQLRKLGVGDDLAKQTAGTNKGPWHSSLNQAMSIALSNAYFENLGLPRFVCKR